MKKTSIVPKGSLLLSFQRGGGVASCKEENGKRSKKGDNGGGGPIQRKPYEIKVSGQRQTPSVRNWGKKNTAHEPLAWQKEPGRKEKRGGEEPRANAPEKGISERSASRL